ncbi:MAG TPA: hypothetical protein VMU16_05465 [Candidatus Binataceae bacterium]|nr:hypothetical protein [Candidatus Binataceae bacterium]
MKQLRLFLGALSIAALLLFRFTINSGAVDAPCGSPCGKPTAWSEFNVYTLKATRPDETGYSSWQGRFARTGSSGQIDLQTFDGHTRKSGRILLVDGRMIAANGNVGAPGDEWDALDGAVLQYQLVIHILGAALPQGTSGLTGTRKIDFLQRKSDITVATMSAKGYYPPPWSAKGTVKLAAPDVVEYNLAVAFGEKGKTGKEGYRTGNLSGRLSKDVNFQLSDSMQLDGYSFSWIEWRTWKMDKNGNPYEISPPTPTGNYRTVGDVRAAIRKKGQIENYPGKRDAGKDFAGFWEGNCSDGFGLRIMHHGNDGKYLVSFCGPGGCMPPEMSRETFISGDTRNYEVVNDNEIIELGSGDWRTTYHRCSKDPHLVLKRE